jgi:hypothetical protein
MIMIGKLGKGNKEQVSGNIPSSMAPSNCATNYMKMRWRPSPVGHIFLKRIGLGK